MIGELAVSFYDRRAGQASVCLDLWSYPDGTYNLVMEDIGDDGNEEFSFPCALHQLAGILDRKPLVNQNEAGVLSIERCGTSVCAEFMPFDGKNGFRYCIGLDEYGRAIEALEASAIGYLA
jgi:hypothetical protein